MSFFSGKCTGKCCQEFVIGNHDSYEEIAKRSNERDVGDPNKQIADMLIVTDYYNQEDVPRFTCRYWDPHSRLCTNYEKRPRMCSDYPYRVECPHCGARFVELLAAPAT